jgi:hypothetical protein
MEELAAAIHREETLTVGEGGFVDCASHVPPFAVVFEDDRDTGYFYAIEMDAEGDDYQILDALHVYTAANVADGDEPVRFQIAWTDDGRRALLLIEGAPWAAFDFERKQGLSRSDFPPPAEGSAWKHLPWDDSTVEELLRGERQQ